MAEGTDNGKHKVELKNDKVIITVDEEVKKALTRGDSAEENINEPTKFILLDNALVESVHDERVKHFTKYKNTDEVITMNDIEAHARLMPIVFKSKDTKVNEKIQKIANLFTLHAHDHMDNMMSLDDKSGNTAKLLTIALKNDNNPYPSDKEMKKMFR